MQILYFLSMYLYFGMTSLTGLDYSQRNPKNIKPSDLLGMYYYRDDGAELEYGRLYITRKQLPPHTRIIHHRQLHTREIRPDRLTIMLDDNDCIINAGVFK